MIGAALALMELGFTYPWSLLVGFWIEGEPRPVLSAWSIVVLVGGAHLVASRLAGSGWPPRLALSAGVALGLALVVATASVEHGPPTPALTPTTLALVLGVHLWRRGLLHAQPPTGRDAVERSLAAGTLALASCLVLAAAAGARSLAVLQEGAAAYVVGFYGVGLSALALARLREVRRQAGGLNDGEGTRGWLGFVGATVLGLLVAAILGGQVLSFDLAAAVLRPIALALSAILFVLFLVLGLPVMIALEALLGWLRQYLGGLPELTMDPQGGLGLEELRRRGPGQPPPEELLLIMQWLAVGLVVALAALLIARALLWRSAARRDDAVPEERDSVWSWALVVDAARGWLARLRRRLARRPTTPAGADAIAAAAEPAAATTVRQLYRAVLALAAGRGAPRPPAATPYEQLPRLQSALGPDETLADVTSAYVRVRYGEHTPAEAELEALRGRWERLREASDRPPRA